MSQFILFLALWFPVFCLRLISYAPVSKVCAMAFECSVIRYPLSFSYLVQFFNCCSTLGRPILFNQSRLGLMENCMPQYYSCFGILQCLIPFPMFTVFNIFVFMYKASVSLLRRSSPCSQQRDFHASSSLIY